MKKLIVAIFILSLCFTAPLHAIQNAYALTELIIDDFSSGDTSTSDKWWKFDGVKLNDKSNSKEDYIVVTGKASDWYVGGMGTYIGKDATEYSKITLTIYGKGKGSGKIKIEMIEDDIGSSEVAQDNKTYQPTKDDKFATKEIDINWVGWKTISIPIKDLELVNPGAGDGKWNPATTNGHYGLLHFQIIALAASPTGKINFGISRISLAN